MKILFVLTYYRPHWTGLTQYAARLAEGLADRGHCVSALCSQHDKGLLLSEIINKVKVKRVQFLFRFSRTVIMPGFPLILFNEIKKNDIIVTYLPLQEIVFVVILAKLFRKQLFLVHNGDLVLPKDAGLMNRLLEKIYFWTSIFAIKNCEKIVVHTKDYADNSKLLSKFKDKWAVAWPPVMMPKITVSEVETFKKKKKLSHRILVGFSGRFVEEKGVDYLLEAIPLVLKKKQNVHFVFAGQYKVSYENFWEKVSEGIEKNKNHISLLGLLDDKREIFVFDRAIDIFVQPSRTDCFPLGQVEAMLSGAPSVCTDIPGARWVVKQSGMGVLVEPRNPQALAEGILKIIEKKEKYKKNIGKVRKLFNYEETIDKFERIFTKN